MHNTKTYFINMSAVHICRLCFYIELHNCCGKYITDLYRNIIVLKIIRIYPMLIASRL